MLFIIIFGTLSFAIGRGSVLLWQRSNALPVFWMTSRLRIVGHQAKVAPTARIHGDSDVISFPIYASCFCRHLVGGVVVSGVRH